MKHYLWIGCILIASILHAQKMDTSLLGNMKMRNIGPAGTSGRVTAIDVVKHNPDIIYVGTASGGLWKSEGGGIDWKPIFNHETSSSIGAIAIDPTNENIIWVGTGEGNPRNSQNNGSGIFRSLDAGKTWQNMGLEKSSNIHRIFIHPTQPNVIWVGVQGNAWADSPERGVFKSTDGGKSWRKVLYVNEKTGIADLTIDPTNPNKMIAGMWEFRRTPWLFTSGGPGSGLFVTYDGGESWKKKTKEDGLPEGEIGKIGVRIAPSDPSIVYALIESKKNALYKSIDGGNKWSKVQDKQVGDRPFYYFDIHVDPQNENRVYSIFSNVQVSQDGGKNFETLLGWDKIHGDHHYWYIHPADGSFMIDGNDGGVAISRDRGKTWRFVENMPVGQFYHINVDMANPYNILGGMQDNGSWRGPSQSLRYTGNRNFYWEEVAFGDGFDVVADADNNRYGYAMWQGGNLMYLDFETGYNRYIKPTHPQDTFLRFHWNSAIAHDLFDNKTIYYGSQFLHKSTDKGQHWSIISPDLTTNDPTKKTFLKSGGLTYDVTGAETYGCILTIAPSPLEPSTIWTGSDDGQIQVTQDGGKIWKNTSSAIKGVKSGFWVPQVTASKHIKGEAFAVVNDYRRGDNSPYLFTTKDYGVTWRRLVDASDVQGYVLSFAQDPIEPKLMFLGTESGLYFSIDGGENWNKWSKDFPTVPVMDLVIHPRDHDLVVGTFGRSIWILDDIRPLREIANKGLNLLNESLHAFETPEGFMFSYKADAGTHFPGDAAFKGQDREFGVSLSYYLSKTAKSDTSIKVDTVIMKIFDQEGKLIRTVRQHQITKGINRIVWDQMQSGVRNPTVARPSDPNASEPTSRWVLPGTYTIKLSYNGKEVSRLVKINTDPRIEIPLEGMVENTQKIDRVVSNLGQLTAIMDQLRDSKASLENIQNQLKSLAFEDEKSVKTKLEATLKTISKLMEKGVGPSDIQGIYDDPNCVMAKIYQSWSYLGLYDFPNLNQNVAIEQGEKVLADFKVQVNQFYENEWIEIKKLMDSKEYNWFKTDTRF